MGSCRYRHSCEDIRQELNAGLSLVRMWLPFASTYATGMTAAESDPLRQRTDQICSTTGCVRKSMWCLKHTHTRYEAFNSRSVLPPKFMTLPQKTLDLVKNVDAVGGVNPE